MQQYSFVTRWRIDAPVDKVWMLIKQNKRWTAWWKGLKKMKLIKEGDADGLGKINEYTFRGALPYSLVFTMEVTLIEQHQKIEGIATGELTGRGLWIFKKDSNSTFLECIWDVATTKAWMNVLALFLKPAFMWNHGVIMHSFTEGVRKELGCEVEEVP